MTKGYKKVPLDFFNRSALVVAKELLGCYLVRRQAGALQRYLITETEAYVGPHDLASHSSKGRTKRTEVMYQPGGTIYVYFIYGMHEMLNIVTGAKDYPAAVLIRAVESKDKVITGPGNVTKALHVDRMINGKVLGKDANLWIESSATSIPHKIIRTPRIGVAYAGPIWANKKYRFLLKKRVQ